MYATHLLYRLSPATQRQSPPDMAHSPDRLTISLPYELLRDIFHQATFIPHEWDLNFTSITHGSLSGWRMFQLRAWRKVLPLRRTIAHVSRSWRAVSLELLYGTFHDYANDGMMESFASILSDCPYYATLVRRLTIRLTGWPEHDAQVAGILRQCSNLLIISIHYKPRGIASGLITLPDLTILPTTIRRLSMVNVPTSTVFPILLHLQNLEMLSIKFMLHSNKAPTPLTVLPNLRMLQIASNYAATVEICSRRLQLPRLSALSIDCLGDSIPTLPNDMAKRLLSLEFIFPAENLRDWNADDLPNLRCLRLRWRHLKADFVRLQLPMKQIEDLTCNLPPVDDSNLLPRIERTMSFILDPNSMPNLKYFTLDISDTTGDTLAGKDEVGSGVRAYLTGLMAAFDQREVNLYCYLSNIPHGRILMRDFLEA